MKKIIFSFACIIAAISTASAQDVIGKWKLEDGTAIVEVYQDGDVYNGKIVWLSNPTEADGTPAKVFSITSPSLIGIAALPPKFILISIDLSSLCL